MPQSGFFFSRIQRQNYRLLIVAAVGGGWRGGIAGVGCGTCTGHHREVKIKNKKIKNENEKNVDSPMIRTDGHRNKQITKEIEREEGRKRKRNASSDFASKHSTV